MGAELGKRVEVHPDGSRETVRPAHNLRQKVTSATAAGGEIFRSNLGSGIGKERDTLHGGEAATHELRHALMDLHGGGEIRVHQDPDGRVRKASYTPEGERTPKDRIRMAEGPGLGRMSDQDMKVRDASLVERDAERGVAPEKTIIDIAGRHQVTEKARQRKATD